MIENKCVPFFLITQVVQALINVIDLGMAPEDAVAAPRIHNQWLPDKLFVESDLSTKVKETLEQRGHTLKQGRHRGATQFIECNGSRICFSFRAPVTN